MCVPSGVCDCVNNKVYLYLSVFYWVNVAQNTFKKCALKNKEGNTQAPHLLADPKAGLSSNLEVLNFYFRRFPSPEPAPLSISKWRPRN